MSERRAEEKAVTARQLIERLQKLVESDENAGELEVTAIDCEGQLFRVIEVGTSRLHGGMMLLQARPYDGVDQGSRWLDSPRSAMSPVELVRDSAKYLRGAQRWSSPEVRAAVLAEIGKPLAELMKQAARYHQDEEPPNRGVDCDAWPAAVQIAQAIEHVRYGEERYADVTQ